MARFSVGARTAATAATLDVQAAIFWNPHSTKYIRVVEVHWAKTVATVDNVGLRRVTARGTASTTVTPGTDNEDHGGTAPVSGVLLDTAWSGAPTITTSTPYLHKWNFPAAVGAGFILPVSIWIPPGKGLAVVASQAVIVQPADCDFVWEE